MTHLDIFMSENNLGFNGLMYISHLIILSICVFTVKWLQWMILCFWTISSTTATAAEYIQYDKNLN